jgi:predicted GNAT family acetyltransferase
MTRSQLLLRHLMEQLQPQVGSSLLLLNLYGRFQEIAQYVLFCPLKIIVLIYLYIWHIIRFGESSSNANIWAHIWEACKRWIAGKRILEKILSIAMEDLQHELEVCEDLVQQHWGSQDPFILLYQYVAPREFWSRCQKIHQGT